MTHSEDDCQVKLSEAHIQWQTLVLSVLNTVFGFCYQIIKFYVLFNLIGQMHPHFSFH